MSDSSQFTEYRRRLAIQNGDTQQQDPKSITKFSVFTPRVSVLDLSKFLGNPTYKFVETPSGGGGGGNDIINVDFLNTQSANNVQFPLGSTTVKFKFLNLQSYFIGSINFTNSAASFTTFTASISGVSGGSYTTSVDKGNTFIIQFTTPVLITPSTVITLISSELSTLTQFDKIDANAGISLSAWTSVSGTQFGSGMGNAVYYGSSTWVTVGGGDGTGNCMYYSSDRITWTSSGAGFFGNAVAQTVYYGNGQWVVGGFGQTPGINLYYSSDGQSWTGVSGPFGVDGSVYKVYYGDRWVAVGQGASGEAGNNIYYSNNSSDWTASASGAFGTGVALSLHYDRSSTWVAVGRDGDPPANRHIWYSTDGGQTWTAATGTPFGNITGSGGSSGLCVFYDSSSGRWVAGGSSAGTGKNIYWSSDGMSWTKSVTGNIFETGQCNSVITFGSKWIAGGNGNGSAIGTNIYYSTDGGINWIGVSGPFGDLGTVNKLFAINGYIIAVGKGAGTESGKNIYYSYDGIVWTPATSTGSIELYDVYADNQNKFVAVGSGTSNIYYLDG